MKRILACFLVLILVSVSVFATAEQISGGWSVSVTAGSLKLDKEDLLKELVDAIIGDYYPSPSRCLPNTEAILNAF